MAERSEARAERSEAPPREARPPPKAAGAGGAPELREGRIRKLEANRQGATQLPRPNADSSFPGSSAPPAQVLRGRAFRSTNTMVSASTSAQSSKNVIPNHSDDQIREWSKRRFRIRPARLPLALLCVCAKSTQPRFESSLIRVWTERCPNEAIWKRICCGFVQVYKKLEHVS